MKTIIISSCLIGLSSDYKGRQKEIKPEIEKLLGSEDVRIIPICPEQAGGLPTPRIASEILDNRTVISETGKDVTENFRKGAEEALYLCRLFSPDLVILKERSPSCGKYRVHDGSFSNVLVEGKGITAELLSQNGYKIVDEEEFDFDMLRTADLSL